MRKNTVIYKLMVADVLNVADELLEKKLDEKELKMVIDRVGNYIPWHDAIENAFIELDFKFADEPKEE